MAKIRHIVFHTTDVERLVKFYVEVMGLTIKHRAENGGVALTDGYLDFSIHTNKIDGKPSGFNHFGFEVEDNDEIAARFKAKGYRPPLKRPGDRHGAVAQLHASAREHELARHEGMAVVALAEQHLRHRGAAVDQHQRGGVARPAVGVRLRALGVGELFGEFVHGCGSCIDASA